MNQIKSSLTILTEEQKTGLHEHSLKILNDVGVKVDSKAAQDILNKSGEIKSRDKIYFFSKEIVNWAIESAPSEIDVYNRLGDKSFTLGKNQDQTVFGIGVTNLNFHEIKSNDIIPFTRSHTGIAAGLCESLSTYNLLSTPGIVADDSINLKDLKTTADMLAGTTKPLSLLISDLKQFEAVLNMVMEITGLPSDTPCILPYFNPVTPLMINDSTVKKMLATIRNGFPFIYSNYGMYGATTPITPAGSLALLNAELLAGLVLSQLIKAGTPVILGSLPASFDMKTMVSAYQPVTSQLNAICAEMMDYYQIPHAGTSGSSTGWAGDINAAGKLWLNHLSSVCGKTGLAPFVGGNFDSLVFSPELVVLSDQIIRDAREFASEFILDEKTIDLQEIKKIGHGGNFLTASQTLEMLPSLYKKPAGLWNNITIDTWRQQGKPKAEEILREKTLEIISHPKVPKDQEEIIALTEEFIEKLKIKTNYVQKNIEY